MELPSEEEVIALNSLALTLIKATKADRHELLNRKRLQEALAITAEDPLTAAALLLERLVKLHPFASGNRRTAFLAMKLLLKKNRMRTAIPDKPENARILQGIREGYYTQKELKEWIEHGTTFHR